MENYRKLATILNPPVRKLLDVELKHEETRHSQHPSNCSDRFEQTPHQMRMTRSVDVFSLLLAGSTVGDAILRVALVHVFAPVRL